MLNWARIEELRDEVGGEAFAEVVDLFLEEVTETIDVLGGDRSQLEAQMHFLKGAALNLGFEDFSILCRDGETAAREGRADSVDVNQVISCFAQTREVFLSRIEESGFMAA